MVLPAKGYFALKATLKAHVHEAHALQNSGTR